MLWGGFFFLSGKMFTNFIYNCIKKGTPLAKGDRKWRLIVKAAGAPSTGGSAVFLAQGDLSSWGLQPQPRPSLPRVAGAGRAGPFSLGLRRWWGNPQFRPPLCLQSASAHQSSTSTPPPPPRRGWGRGDLTRRFHWRPERFLPLHPLLSYPEHSIALCLPLNTLAFCPPLPKGKSASQGWHPHTSPEPRAQPWPTVTLRRHKQAVSLLRDPHTWCRHSHVVQLDAHWCLTKHKHPPSPHPKGNTKATKNFKTRQHRTSEREPGRTKTSLRARNEQRQLWDVLQCPLA